MFCISFPSAQDPRELAVSPWEWTGHLNVRDNAAEIFTLPNEQFLILPEGRFSPGCCGEEGRRAPATERISTLRQLDPLEIPPFFLFLFFYFEWRGGCWCEKWHWQEQSLGKPMRSLGRAAPSYMGSALPAGCLPGGCATPVKTPVIPL